MLDVGLLVFARAPGSGICGEPSFTMACILWDSAPRLGALSNIGPESRGSSVNNVLGTLSSYMGIALLFIAYILTRLDEVSLLLPLAMILFGIPTLIVGLRARGDLASARNLISWLLGLASAGVVMRFYDTWPWSWLVALSVGLVVILAWTRVVWPRALRMAGAPSTQPN